MGWRRQALALMGAAVGAGGNQGSLDQLSASEIAAVSAVSTVTSTLSIAGSVFIIACYLGFKNLRKLSFTLVAILSATDVLNQVFDLVRPTSEELAEMNADPSYVSGVCYFQAIGDNFFELASVLWTTAIAATLYATVIWRMKLVDNRGTLLRFSAFCFGLPLILTIAPAADGAFGAAGGACWIKESKAYWRFISFYAPLWGAIAFNIFVYARVTSLLRSTVRTAGANDAVAQNIRAMMRRLNIYPFILLTVWLIPSIQEIVEAATGRQFFVLSLFAFATAGLQGTLNAFAYGFSTGVRDAIRNVAARYLPCIKDTQSLAVQSLMDSSAPHLPGGVHVTPSPLGGATGGTGSGGTGGASGTGGSGIAMRQLPPPPPSPVIGGRAGGGIPAAPSTEASDRYLVPSAPRASVDDDDFVDDRYTRTALPSSVSSRMAGSRPPTLAPAPTVVVNMPVDDDV